MIYDNRRTREPSQVIINQQRLPKEVSQEELLNGPYLQHIKKMLGDPQDRGPLAHFRLEACPNAGTQLCGGRESRTVF